jgi:hypothetical protein
MTTGPAEGVWWVVRFVMIGIILLGVTFIVGKFYSNQDIRPVEALAISNKVIDCISAQGVVDMNKVEKAEILECINLNENEVYVNLTAASLDSSLNKSASLGVSMQVYCESMEKGMKTPIKCLRQKFYVLIGNEKGRVDLLVGIKKVEQNA